MTRPYFIWQRCEVGQFTQRDIDLAGRAARAEVLDGRDKVIGKVFRLDELQERALRVRGRHHYFRIKFISIFEDDTDSASAFDLNLLYTCIDSDLHPKCFRRVKNGAADSARAVLGKAPGTESAINFTHVMMEQHIC